MPIPREQLELLENDLKAHEERLASLKDSIRFMQEEVVVHETLLAMGRDENVLAALNNLYDHPDLISKTADHPTVYFEEKGVKLPPDSTVTVSTRVEACFNQGCFKYKVTWDSSKGFSLAPIDNQPVGQLHPSVRVEGS